MEEEEKGSNEQFVISITIKDPHKHIDQAFWLLLKAKS
jgi:hypothetical protein